MRRLVGGGEVGAVKDGRREGEWKGRGRNVLPLVREPCLRFRCAGEEAQFFEEAVSVFPAARHSTGRSSGNCLLFPSPLLMLPSLTQVKSQKRQFTPHNILHSHSHFPPRSRLGIAADCSRSGRRFAPETSFSGMACRGVGSVLGCEEGVDLARISSQVS